MHGAVPFPIEPDRSSETGPPTLSSASKTPSSLAHFRKACPPAFIPAIHIWRAFPQYRGLCWDGATHSMNQTHCLHFSSPSPVKQTHAPTNAKCYLRMSAPAPAVRLPRLALAQSRAVPASTGRKKSALLSPSGSVSCSFFSFLPSSCFCYLCFAFLQSLPLPGVVGKKGPIKSSDHTNCFP